MGAEGARILLFLISQAKGQRLVTLFLLRSLPIFRVHMEIGFFYSWSYMVHFG